MVRSAIALPNSSRTDRVSGRDAGQHRVPGRNGRLRTRLIREYQPCDLDIRFCMGEASLRLADPTIRTLAPSLLTRPLHAEPCPQFLSEQCSNIDAE